MEAKHLVGAIVLAIVVYLVKDETSKLLRQRGWLA